MKQKNLSVRWFYLVLGVTALLFAGIIYGWSILKVPLAESFGWTADQLALNFTVTMCFFCLGGFVGGMLTKKVGTRTAMILAGAAACAGFVMTARLDGSSVIMLYISYGVLAGLGIGIAYNAVISTVNAWFPDKKGTSSGALMMGFGASALVVGNLASMIIETSALGWRTAYMALGVALGVILVITGLVLQEPPEGLELPQPEKKASRSDEDFEVKDYTPGEMVRRFTFWRAFACLMFCGAVGNTVISFAKDLSLSVGAGASLATTLVGVLSVCNGLGRIVTGALFDKLGRRKTMLLANVVAIAAAAVTLVSVFMSSVPLCVLGLCVTGFSYGACPTITSAFVSGFYGSKHFPMNFSIMNFTLMGASFMATAASKLLISTGGYAAPFMLLLTLAVLSLFLNLSIKRP